MKKILALFILSTTLFSCSNDDDSSSESSSEKWVLTQMSGSIPDSETTGSEMAWQETYLLKTDGAFKKSRDTDGVITEASGTYIYIDASDKLYLELIFNNESDIIGSCNTELKEEMFFESENIFHSSWQSCDGPVLRYERVN